MASRPSRLVVSEHSPRNDTPASSLHPSPPAARLAADEGTTSLTSLLLISRSRKKAAFSEEEDDLLLKLHALLGNRWSLIAGRIPGRTEKEVKNQWNSKLKRMATDHHPPENNRAETTTSLEHRRRLRSEARGDQRGAKHPRLYSPSSSSPKGGASASANGDDCCPVPDASSCNRSDHRITVPELNLDLTLSTPCIYSEKNTR
ncbi:hypothetical protein GUJ93_ZPchr0008g11608 [Zizania palustris]|uniref:Uncharacterized protein n=1 Tax=Zizania palustris TaxID=103762 RepID=A0A8J5VJ61_ZIZPA|nr:hypothetical protein GUJ93_ZPchr0008g11608 [Zizania palustris]